MKHLTTLLLTLLMSMGAWGASKTLRLNPYACDINNFTDEQLNKTFLECSGILKVNQQGNVSESKVIKEVRIIETKEESCSYLGGLTYKALLIDAEQRQFSSKDCVYGEDEHLCYYVRTLEDGTSVDYSYDIKISRKTGRMDFEEYYDLTRGSYSSKAEDMLCRKIEDTNLF